MPSQFPQQPIQQIPQQPQPQQVQQPQLQQYQQHQQVQRQPEQIQQQHHQPQLQQQLQLQQQQQVVHHIHEPVQAQPNIQLAQQQQHEQPHNAQLQSHTHVQQPKEREQQDLPPNDHPKPAQLDVVHSEILESTKIDGKEDWDAFKLKFNRLAKAHHWTTLEKRDNLRFCLTGVISELYFLMLKKKWAFHEIMQGLEVSFGLPEVAQLLEQERCADTKTVVAPCLAGTSVHAGNPVGSISPTTNIVYAGRLEQTHDLSGAKLIPLSLKRSSELTLHNSSQVWSTLIMNLRIKLQF